MHTKFSVSYMYPIHLATRSSCRFLTAHIQEVAPTEPVGEVSVLRAIYIIATLAAAGCGSWAANSTALSVSRSYSLFLSACILALLCVRVFYFSCFRFHARH